MVARKRQTGWRIDEKLKQWIDIEAVKRRVSSSSLVEEAIRRFKDGQK